MTREELKAAVVAYCKANQFVWAPNIAEQLGVEPDEVQTVLEELQADGVLKSRGTPSGEGHG